MPPLWKIRREVLRSWRQILDLPRDLFERYFATAIYDNTRGKHVRLRNGEQPDGHRKAVYLMYPRNGVKPSHIRTIRYLANNGLSVTVVSNLPLSSMDEDRVCGMCHRFIERPNFGYDFGGYRDALLELAPEIESTEQLVLMNDSVWFPLHSHSDWLADVARLNVDFAGAASHFGFRRIEPVDFRQFTFKYETSRKNFHYGSFALSVGPRILRDPAFLKFWRNLRLSDSKRKTVKFGETGLTKWVLESGYSHGDTLGAATLKKRLDALDHAALAVLVKQVISFENARIKDTQKAMLKGQQNPTRDEMILFLMTAAAVQGPGYVLAYFTILDLGYPFLKKSPIWLDTDAAETSIDILEQLGTPAAMEALDEARMLKNRS